MRFRRVTAGGAIVLALFATACSSGSDYCEQKDAVASSFDTLVGTDVLAEGTDTLRERYDAFTSELGDLADAAKSEFGDEVSAVQTAADDLGDAIGSIGDMGLAEAATTIAPLIQNLQSSFGSLLTALDSACG